MARVPTVDTPNTIPSAGSPTLVSNATLSQEAAARPFNQTNKLAQNAGEAAGTMSDYALDEIKRANDLRVADAANQARQVALDAAYDKDNGYLRLRGNDALSRPEGISLADEYDKIFNDKIGAIASSLGNDAQRTAFEQQVGQIRNSFLSGVKEHTFREYVSHGTSVADGTLKLAKQETLLSWRNPERVDQAINGYINPDTGERIGGVKEAIYNKAKLTGLSANETTAAIHEEVSRIHEGVIGAALENNDAEYAAAYYQQHKDEMSGNSLVKTQSVINAQLDYTAANQAVNKVFSARASELNPNDFDRVVGVVIAMESSGRQTEANGAPVMSPKGAIGIMQLMPATAKEVAQKNNIEWDENKLHTDKEYNKRLGSLYLSEQLRNFGDLNKALAAYNAGPGAVKQAVSKAEKGGAPENWLAYLPEETRNYVEKGSNKFFSGGGSAPRASLRELTEAAVAQLGDNPRPEAVKAATDLAAKKYKIIEEERQTQSENAMFKAQQELLENGGVISQLSPETLMQVKATDIENWKKLQDFAKVVATPATTNLEAYAEAVASPDNLAKMSNSVFTQYLKENFAESDAKYISKLRADVLSGKADNSVSSVNHTALNNELGLRLSALGINDKADRAKAFMEVKQEIIDAQIQTGKKFGQQEIIEAVDKHFRAQVSLPRSSLGKLFRGVGNYSEKVADLSFSDVPAEIAARIANRLTSRGYANPTEDEILAIYKSGLVTKDVVGGTIE